MNVCGLGMRSLICETKIIIIITHDKNISDNIIVATSLHPVTAPHKKSRLLPRIENFAFA